MKLEPKDYQSTQDREASPEPGAPDDGVLSPKLFYEASRRLEELHEYIHNGRYSAAEEYLFLSLFLVAHFKRHPNDLRITMLWNQLNQEMNGVDSALRRYGRAEDCERLRNRMRQCEEESRALAQDQEYQNRAYLKSRFGKPPK